MLLTFQLVISEAEMRLTWKSSLKSHLSYLNMIHIALIVLAQVEESLANCYTSPVMVPTIGQTKHVEISIHPGEQIISLQESIELLKNVLEFQQEGYWQKIHVVCIYHCLTSSCCHHRRCRCRSRQQSLRDITFTIDRRMIGQSEKISCLWW